MSIVAIYFEYTLSILRSFSLVVVVFVSFFGYKVYFVLGILTFQECIGGVPQCYKITYKGPSIGKVLSDDYCKLTDDYSNGKIISNCEQPDRNLYLLSHENDRWVILGDKDGAHVLAKRSTERAEDPEEKVHVCGEVNKTEI